MTAEQHDILISNAHDILRAINRKREGYINRNGFFNESILSYRLLATEVFCDVLQVDHVEFSDEEMRELFERINRELFH